MKKFLLSAICVLMALFAQAQIYDGITQPTTYRFAIPATISTEDGSSSIAPFIGYKCEPTEWLSVTPIVQYNTANNALIPQVWLNFDVNNTVYLLSRSIYDGGTGKYRHGMATTIKLPAGFMIDATWDNFINGSEFAHGDRLQAVAGYAHSWIVFNMGYSMRSHPGFIANVRFKITELSWVQLKYDGGLKAVSLTSLFHI